MPSSGGVLLHQMKMIEDKPLPQWGLSVNEYNTTDDQKPNAGPMPTVPIHERCRRTGIAGGAAYRKRCLSEKKRMQDCSRQSQR